MTQTSVAESAIVPAGRRRIFDEGVWLTAGQAVGTAAESSGSRGAE